jgi:hypothetical protein
VIKKSGNEAFNGTWKKHLCNEERKCSGEKSKSDFLFNDQKSI